jgi:tetratricopeptide (TPR) repeat protein
MMKKLLFFILTISLSTSTTFGQDAAQAYKNAKKAYSAAATAESDKRAEKLEEARAQIDIAIAGIDQIDEKTLPKVWMKSAEIYSDLAKTDFTLSMLPGSDYKIKYPEANSNAYTAYVTALKIPNLKKYYKTEALDGLKTLSGFLSNDGREAFNAKDYKKAYEAFADVSNIDNILTQNKQQSIFEDTEKRNEHLYVTGLSAFAADMHSEAKAIFIQLDKDNYESAGIYDSLFKIYSKEEKTEEALAILEKGREKYPDDEILRVSEINYYLVANKLDVLTGKLKAAIEADPKNVTLYSTLGHVYDNLSQNERDSGNIEQSEEYFNLALDYYTQALEIDGTHFNTIYNTGALYYNKAAFVTRELIEIEEDYSAAGLRKSEAKRAEMMNLFDKALPFFQKAEAVEPNDIGTLSALKEIYARKDNLEMAKEFKSRMEIVQNGGTNETAYFN